MALVTLPAPFSLPIFFHNELSASVYIPTGTLSTGILLDAAGEKAAFITKAPKTGNIAKVYFRTSTVTTATNTDVRVETVNTANGNPSGTLWDTDTNVVVPASSMTSNSWIAATLTSPASVNRGDILAIVIAPTGTPNYYISRYDVISSNFPYVDHYTTSWAKISKLPIFILEYSDGYMSTCEVGGIFPDRQTRSFNANSNPDEVGNKFVLPFKYRLAGVSYHVEFLDGNPSIKVYVGSTLHESIPIDPDIEAAISPIYQTHFLTNPLVVDPNTTIRVTVTTDSTSTAAVETHYINPYYINVLPFGTSITTTQRTDGGAFTDVSTSREFCTILIDQLDDGSGGGSGGGSGLARIIGG